MLSRLVSTLPVLAVASVLLLPGPGGAGGDGASVPGSRAEIALSFAPVVRAAAPAVVNIHALRLVRDRAGPLARDPFFREFFEDFARSSTREQTTLGSGVIVDPRGIVISNHHVVAGARDIRVVLSDRREYAAEIILADAAIDLAVLRLEGASGLPALPFGDPDALEVGDLVLAIGNPFGIGQTVSSGIVSGLGRTAVAPGQGGGYFIQTDAAINPGNSGGALVDMGGRLVGINTSILTRSGGFQGIGFAIPSSLVAQVVAQAQDGQPVLRRPWSSIDVQAVDAGLAEALGLPAPRGVVLRESHPQSPFRAAGMVPGDVLIAIGDADVDTAQELEFRLALLGPGAATGLRWLRSGQSFEAGLVLTLPPELPARAPVTVTGDTPLQGLSAVTVNPAVIVEQALPLSASGVAVIATEGVARRLGLRLGDVIVRINGRDLNDTADLARAAGEHARQWEIAYLRDGRRGLLRFRW